MGIEYVSAMEKWLHTGYLSPVKGFATRKGEEDLCPPYLFRRDGEEIPVEDDEIGELTSHE